MRRAEEGRHVVAPSRRTLRAYLVDEWLPAIKTSFYPLYLLAATTGLRRAELCGLRWPALDLDAGTLSVVPDTRVVVNGQTQNSDGKTGTPPRMLALDPLTIAALHEWQSRQESERVFFDRDYHDTNRVFVWEDGRPVHPDVIRQWFNRLSLRCGLPHIRLHDMRHSYATAALKAGVHLKIVNARLGHASKTFTASVYQHALPGMDREAAGTIAALFIREVPDRAVNESVSKESETDSQMISDCPCSLVAGTGFEPVTSGL